MVHGDRGERKSLERKKGHRPWQSHEAIESQTPPWVPCTFRDQCLTHNLLSPRLKAEAREVFLVGRGREIHSRHSQDTSPSAESLTFLKNQPPTLSFHLPQPRKSTGGQMHPPTGQSKS